MINDVFKTLDHANTICIKKDEISENDCFLRFFRVPPASQTNKWSVTTALLEGVVFLKATGSKFIKMGRVVQVLTENIFPLTDSLIDCVGYPQIALPVLLRCH